jgi:predicted nucleic acid-binding protein
VPKNDTFVLDSYALIGYLEDEPFAQWFQQVLLSARKRQCKLYLHAIQLGEVYSIILREQGKQIADLAYARIKDFPISLIETIDENLLLSAASIKASFPLSYADAFAAALAKIHDAVLLTGDPEFKTLEENKIIKIKWLESS